MTWIKICGTTNLEDAKLAMDAGADAVGFVFAESKRKVTPEQAAEIVWELPSDIAKVGVFVQDPPEVVESIVKVAGLTGVQLHAHEDWPIAERVAAESGCDVFRVLHIGQSAPEFPAEGAAPRLDTIVMDTAVHGRRGGTGQTWDWTAFAPFIQALKKHFNVVIGGGLTPENVGEAIRVLRPWGVDVVTGVERQPGRKDPAKVRDFVEAVRRADAEITPEPAGNGKRVAK